jgi:hypothetical protein
MGARHIFHGQGLASCRRRPLSSNVRRQRITAALHCRMPELSRFLGIVIAMYYRDHNPPHFHAIYGDFEITVEVATGKVNGDFPKRALAHVLEWKNIHTAELMNAWSLARASNPLPRIDPLE